MGRNDISTGELLEAMINGECDQYSDLDFALYLKENNLESAELLQSLLEQVDTVIKVTMDSVFVGKYDRELLSCLRKRLAGDHIDPKYLEYLKELKEEEMLLEQAGKKSLYKAIEERGFFNDAHEITVSSAWYDQNIDLLKHYWEEMVLGKILEFRRYIQEVLEDRKEIPLKDCNVREVLEDGKEIPLKDCNVQEVVEDGKEIPLKDCNVQEVVEEHDSSDRLTLKQLALICFYKKTPVYTPQKGKKILQEFNSSSTSGKKLYDDYVLIKQNNNRIGATGKSQSDNRRLVNFEKVIKYFENEGNLPDMLMSDFEELKKNIEKNK